MANDNLLTVNITDDAGKPKTVNVFFTASTTLAQIQGWATEGIASLDAMIDGVIESAEVTLAITLPGGLKTTPVANSTVRRGALLSFDNPTRYKWDQYIPTFTPSSMPNGVVDQTAAGIVDWLGEMVNGVTVSAVLIQPTNASGEDLTDIHKATETFRK